MVIKMQEIADMGYAGILFQCPECKTVKVFKNRIPECDCVEKDRAFTSNILKDMRG